MSSGIQEGYNTAFNKQSNFPEKPAEVNNLNYMTRPKKTFIEALKQKISKRKKPQFIEKIDESFTPLRVHYFSDETQSTIIEMMEDKIKSLKECIAIGRNDIDKHSDRKSVV